MKDIIFIGIGKMGQPMAAHLARAGHRVRCVEASTERRAELARAGWRIHATLAQALQPDEPLQEPPVLISSLPHDAALLAVAEDIARAASDGGLPAGAIYLDTSTVSVDASAQVDVRCEQMGLQYLRATVSGNNVMAQQAALTVMCSGPQSAYETCVPLLTCWGPKRFYLGAAEQARTMKLVINLMIAATSGMLAEALTLGQRGGLTWDDLWTVITDSAVASPIIKAKQPALQRRDYTPTFTVEQMRKDVGLIKQASDSVGTSLPITTVVQEQLDQASAQGDGELDYAAIIRVAERAVGLTRDGTT